MQLPSRCTTVRAIQHAIATDFDARIARLHAPVAPSVIKDAFSWMFSWLDENMGTAHPWVYWNVYRLHRDIGPMLESMFMGLARMRLRATAAAPFEKDSGWTLWITTHLRPLSPHAPAGKTLEEKLLAVNKKWTYYGSDRWARDRERVTKQHAKQEAKGTTVDPARLAMILNLLPDFAIDALWLHRSSTSAMAWLRADLREHCTRVHERFIARTWIDQSNVLCKLDQHHDPLLGKFPTVLLQKIAQMASNDARAFTVRLPKVDSMAVMQKQLAELAGAAADLPLATVRAHLKRMYESIPAEEAAASGKRPRVTDE